MPSSWRKATIEQPLQTGVYGIDSQRVFWIERGLLMSLEGLP